jgi:hypothetical protein
MMKRNLFVIFLIIILSGCQKDETVDYIAYIKHFKQSIAILDRINCSVYQEFEAQLVRARPRVSPFYDKLIQLKSSKAILIHMIDSIQADKDTFVINKILNDKLIDPELLEKKVELNLGDIELIKTSLLDYERIVKGIISPTIKNKGTISSIIELLYTDKLEKIKIFNHKSVCLAEFHAFMFKLKADIYLAEKIVVKDLFHMMDAEDDRFSTAVSFVQANSLQLPVGESFKAWIYRPETYCYDSVYLRIDNIESKVKGCKAAYRFKITEKPGKYEKEGSFIIKDKYIKATKNIPFKIEYEVLKPNKLNQCQANGH